MALAPSTNMSGIQRMSNDEGFSVEYGLFSLRGLTRESLPYIRSETSMVRICSKSSCAKMFLTLNIEKLTFSRLVDPARLGDGS